MTGKLQSLSAIKRALGTRRLQAVGFADYSTPNKGKAMAERLLKNLKDIQDSPDDIKI